MPARKKKIIFSAISVCFILVLGSIVSTERFTSLIDRAHLCEEISRSAGDLKMILIDAETGERGFIITGDEDYLVPYNNSVLTIDQALTTFSLYSSTQPDTEKLTTNIIDMAHRKMDGLAKIITIRRNDGFPAAREEVFIGLSRGKTLMDNLRSQIQKVQTDESHLNDKLLNESKKFALISLFCVIFSALGMIVIVVFINLLLRVPHILPD